MTKKHLPAIPKKTLTNGMINFSFVVTNNLIFFFSIFGSLCCWLVNETILFAFAPMVFGTLAECSATSNGIALLTDN